MTYTEAIRTREASLNGRPTDPAVLQRAIEVIAGHKEPTFNPWNLTEREIAAMTAVIQHGRAKSAASAMGISHRTVEVYFCAARKKMGVSSLVQAAVFWDRHLRGQVVA